jgi:hypothetical protein
MGLLPLLNVIQQNGGANVVSTNMVAQLQANNLQFTRVDEEECQFYLESLFAWMTGTVTGNQVNGFRRDPSQYVSEFAKTMSHNLQH